MLNQGLANDLKRKLSVRITFRAFSNHQEPTKCVGYFAQRSRLLFSRKNWEATGFNNIHKLWMNWFHILRYSCVKAIFQSIFHKFIGLRRICLREKYVIYKWNKMLNLNVQDTLDIKHKHFTTNIPDNRKFKYSIKWIYPEARKKPVQLLYHTNTVACNKRNQSCHSTEFLWPISMTCQGFWQVEEEKVKFRGIF